MRELSEKGSYFLNDVDDLSNISANERYNAIEFRSIGGQAMQILHDPILNEFHINIVADKQDSFLVTDDELKALHRWLEQRLYE